MEMNLLVAGFGGQGVMTLGKFLAMATCDFTDKHVTFFPSYGAQQRGGTANCYVVISDDLIGTPMGDKVDYLIVMNEPSARTFLDNLKPGGVVFVNSSIVKDNIPRDDITIIRAPVTELALKIGDARILNVIMLGVFVGYTQMLSPEIIWKTIAKKKFSNVQVYEWNRQAFEIGLKIGMKMNNIPIKTEAINL